MTVTIELHRATATAPQDPKRTFKYPVVNDQLFTPLLAYVSMFNTLGSYERQFGAATIGVKSRARIKGHGDLSSRTCSPATTRSSAPSTAVAGPLTMLLANNIEPITLEGLDITVDASETPRRVTIERVWLDDIRPRAGRTVPLKVLTRCYRGEEKISTRADRDSGERARALSILVTDGRQLNAMEQRDAAPLAAAADHRADDPRAQRHAPQQPHLRPAAHRPPGAVVNGEAHDGAPAVGALGARKRSQRRQLHPDPQRRASANGRCRWTPPSPARACSRSKSTARPAVDAGRGLSAHAPMRVVRSRFVALSWRSVGSRSRSPVSPLGLVLVALA